MNLKKGALDAFRTVVPPEMKELLTQIKGLGAVSLFGEQHKEMVRELREGLEMQSAYSAQVKLARQGFEDFFSSKTGGDFSRAAGYLENFNRNQSQLAAMRALAGADSLLFSDEVRATGSFKAAAAAVAHLQQSLIASSGASNFLKDLYASLERQKASPLYKLAAEEAQFSDLDLVEVLQTDVVSVGEPQVTHALKEMSDEAIVKSVQVNGGVQNLGAESRARIRDFFFVLLFIIEAINSLVSLYENIEKAKLAFAHVQTPAEVRVVTRKGLAGIDTTILQGIRVITGKDVNLRSDAGRKHDVITTLQIGDVVEVLDASQRAWLKIGITVRGEWIEGWVYRRYAAPIR